MSQRENEDAQSDVEVILRRSMSIKHREGHLDEMNSKPHDKLYDIENQKGKANLAMMALIMFQLQIARRLMPIIPPSPDNGASDNQLEKSVGGPPILGERPGVPRDKSAKG